MIDDFKTDPWLYRDECPGWLLTQHFGLSPTHCTLYHTNNLTQPRMEISKACMENGPNYSLSINLAPGRLREEKTNLKSIPIHSFFQCEVLVLSD